MLTRQQLKGVIMMGNCFVESSLRKSLDVSQFKEDAQQHDTFCLSFATKMFCYHTPNCGRVWVLTLNDARYL